MYTGNRLHYWQSICDCGIEDEDVLEIHAKQRGGKSVIYLFSSRALDVSVSPHLILQWSFLVIYPVVSINEDEDGVQYIAYNVHVNHGGTLFEKSSG